MIRYPDFCSGVSGRNCFGHTTEGWICLQFHNCDGYDVCDSCYHRNQCHPESGRWELECEHSWYLHPKREAGKINEDCSKCVKATEDAMRR